MALPNFSTFNVQNPALNVQSGLNVNSPMPYWPFGQPSVSSPAVPVFGGAFSPSSLNVQGGLNVQNAPSVQDVPMHTTLPTGNDWLGSFGHAWTSGVGDLFNASGIPTAASAWWQGVGQLNPFGGSSPSGVPPGLTGPTGTLATDPLGGPPAGTKGPVTGKVTGKTKTKTTPAAPSYTPLVWHDIHTPLPTFTEPPGYVSPGKYLPLYTPEGIKAENAAQNAVVNAFAKWGADYNKLQNVLAHLPSLTPKARADAMQDVQGLVNSIKDQQRALEHQGVLNQTALMSAGNAAANMQMGIGRDVAQSYTNAAQTIGSLAGGIAGAMGNASAGALNTIAGNLPGGTALAKSLVPGVATAGFAPNAAAALNQIQGSIPSAGLAAQGPQAQAASEQSAMALLGGGRQAGMLALAGAEQAANNLQPQITAAYNSLPALTRQYLSTYTSERNSWIDQQLQLMAQRGQISTQEASAAADVLKTRLDMDAQNRAGENTFNVGQAAAHNAYNTSLSSAENSFAIARAGIQGQDLRTNAAGQISVASANAAAIRSAASTLAATIRANASLAAGKRAAAKDLDAKATKMADLATQFALGKYTTPSSTRGGAGAQLVDEPIAPQDALRKMVARYPSLAATRGGMDLILYSLSVAYGPMKIVQTTDENGKPTAVPVGWPPNNDFNTYNAIKAWPVTSDKSGPALAVTGTG